VGIIAGADGCRSGRSGRPAKALAPVGGSESSNLSPSAKLSANSGRSFQDVAALSADSAGTLDSGRTSADAALVAFGRLAHSRFARDPQSSAAPLEPSLAVSPGETRVCAHQRGERL
jgi:hypothetical protein